jgi:hypothetical protein
LGVKCEEKPLITSKGKKSFLTYVISKSEGKAPKEKKRKKTKRKTPSDYYKRAESLEMFEPQKKKKKGGRAALSLPVFSG